MTKSFPLLAVFAIVASCAVLNPPKQPEINPNDIVRWSDTTKLSWDDFQGKPIESAQIGSEIVIQSPAYFHKATIFLPATTTVECYMDKRVSWVTKSQINVQLLFYNQTLFDLYELCARRLRKKFAETNFGIADPTGVFNSIYQSNSNEAMQEISRYRNETAMGRKALKIKEWSDTIWKALQDLNEYR